MDDLGRCPTLVLPKDGCTIYRCAECGRGVRRYVHRDDFSRWRDELLAE
jgi:hypothetical protein